MKQFEVSHKCSPCDHTVLSAQAFIRSDANVLVLADSDMLFDPGWLGALRRVAPWSAGAMSLYNSANHKPLHCDGVLCVKKVIGCVSLPPPCVAVARADMHIE